MNKFNSWRIGFIGWLIVKKMVLDIEVSHNTQYVGVIFRWYVGRAMRDRVIKSTQAKFDEGFTNGVDRFHTIVGEWEK